MTRSALPVSMPSAPSCARLNAISRSWDDDFDPRPRTLAAVAAGPDPIYRHHGFHGDDAAGAPADACIQYRPGHRVGRRLGLCLVRGLVRLAGGHLYRPLRP